MFAQFAGTSVWFATNAVIGDLEASLGLEDATAWLTGAVQFGFIAGTMLLSGTGLADRYSPRIVFLVGCLLAAVANLGTLSSGTLMGLAGWRFACGAALAAVYPIGMKVAAGWFREGLGNALGWLVGALVLGTAFPHLLRAVATGFPWATVVLGTSTLAALGGVALAASVPDGPHLKASPRLDLSAVPRLWKIPRYRASALGYFGHMWELYTFWALLPALILATTQVESSLGAFAVIAGGTFGCVAGGIASRAFGSAAVARTQLLVSGFCCAIAPLVFQLPSAFVWVLLGVWGISVVGDSPQFSALSARAAPPELVGTGLAFATAVGFSLTVVSLAIVGLVPLTFAPWVLLPGPVLGLWALRDL